MTSVQLGVGLAQALVRLRAYAQHRPVAEVAADVMARRQRFEQPDRSQP